jgi:pyruvate dehydrogenase kinase 2/3/4
MMDFGSFPIERQLLVSAQFLHKELPVRLAHRVAELENLPFGLSSKRAVHTVRDWYVESFRELRAFPPIRDMSTEETFTGLIRRIMARHNNVVPMIARGVHELRAELDATGGADLRALPEIHQFLDGFYMSRIGVRMLIGQHVALHAPPRDGFIGMICTQLSPRAVAEDAIADARSICMRQYGDAPDVEIFGDPKFTFAYVPGHLHQMLFELVKNSLRAVQDRWHDREGAPPCIRLVVAEGEEDITIKLSDEGGGIARSGLPRIWTYLYSTAKSPLPDVDIDAEMAPVLAGYGYGLPLSRLYARYFGGDLQVISMEGYGTECVSRVRCACATPWVGALCVLTWRLHVLCSVCVQCVSAFEPAGQRAGAAAVSARCARAGAAARKGAAYRTLRARLLE